MAMWASISGNSMPVSAYRTQSMGIFFSSIRSKSAELSFPPDTEMEQKLLLFSLVFIGNSLLKQKISPGRNEVLSGLV